MKKRRLLAAVCVAVTGLSLAACSSSGSKASGGSGGGSSSIVVGGIFSLTGADAVYDVPISNGLKVAIQEVNDGGGVTVDGKKYTFDLHVEDAKSQPTVSVAGARKLVTEDKAKIIFGNGTSDTGAPTAQYIMQQDVIYFGTFTQLEGLLGKDGASHLFRQWGSAASLDKTYIPAALDALGIKKGVAAIFPNEDVSKAVIGGDKPIFEGANAPIVQQELFQTGTTDFSPILGQVNAGAIDGLYVGYSQSDLQNLVRQAVTQGKLPLKFVTYGGSNQAAVDNKDKIEGYAWQYFTRAVDSSTDPKVVAFADAYKKVSGRTTLSAIDAQALGFYDSFKALAAGITKAGTTSDVGKLSDTLHNACYNGVRTLCWDKDGRAIANYDMGVLTNGQITIKTVPVDKPAGSTTLP
jgi:branched-chain amino acid transport system substrate-binding protein